MGGVLLRPCHAPLAHTSVFTLIPHCLYCVFVVRSNQVVKASQICASSENCFGRVFFFFLFLAFPYTFQNQVVNLFPSPLKKKNSLLEGLFLKVGIAKQMEEVNVTSTKPVTYKGLEVAQIGRNLFCSVRVGDEVG